MQELKDMMARIRPDVLEKAMEIKGWGLEDLEKQSGVEKATLNEFLNGKMLAARSAGKIADALQVSVEELFRVREKRARQMLQEYRADQRELETQYERVRILEQRITPGSQRLDGMPHGNGGTPSDPTGDQAIRMAELREDIDELAKYQKEKRKEIKAILRKMENPDERMVLQMKYIDGMEWEEITLTLYGKRKDYKKAMEIYANKAYKLHGAALLSMEQCIE